MKYRWFIIALITFLVLTVDSGTSHYLSKDASGTKDMLGDTTQPLPRKSAFAFAYSVPHDVRVKDYFRFMDTLIQRLDTLVAYDLNGILLARANPWVMDSFIETDYYRRKAKGEVVLDQKQLIILHTGDTLRIPNDAFAAELKAKIDVTWLDINIPEFRMRIVEGSDTLYAFTVRVGQNRKRFLKAIDRIEDLRTKTGVGRIIRVNRYPAWRDPVTGKQYKDTGRDDGLRTKLPQIPWLEPVINGRYWGQMIHPTTNPESLGKTYSNGCIGTSEEDAWRIYFHAPIGTKVVIRYDRLLIGPEGDSTWLPDVYNKKKFKLRT